MYSDYSNLLKTGKKSKLGTISSQIYQAERDRWLGDKYRHFGNACMVVTSKLCAAFDAHNENKKCELDAASLSSATKEKDESFFRDFFNNHIEDTVGDRLAICVIEMLGYSGAKSVFFPDDMALDWGISVDIPIWLMQINHQWGMNFRDEMSDMGMSGRFDYQYYYLKQAIAGLFVGCKMHDILIIEHINARLRYDGFSIEI